MGKTHHFLGNKPVINDGFSTSRLVCNESFIRVVNHHYMFAMHIGNLFLCNSQPARIFTLLWVYSTEIAEPYFTSLREGY